MPTSMGAEDVQRGGSQRKGRAGWVLWTTPGAGLFREGRGTWCRSSGPRLCRSTVRGSEQGFSLPPASPLPPWVPPPCTSSRPQQGGDPVGCTHSAKQDNKSVACLEQRHARLETSTREMLKILLGPLHPTRRLDASPDLPVMWMGALRRVGAVTAVNSALSPSPSLGQPVITASLSQQPVTATIPSQRPVLAGRDATQADKTNGLATHTEWAPGRGAWLQAPPAPPGRHGCPCAWALPSGGPVIYV